MLSFAFRWANSVDPIILHFDETHSQSESGKIVGNARENDCDCRMVCVAWKRQTDNTKNPGKESWNSFTTYHPGDRECHISL